MSTIAILGCGTLGCAIVSGVLESKESPSRQPTAFDTPTSSILVETHGSSGPARFIACVSRDESARRLQRTYSEEPRVDVRVRGNVKATQDADVVVLACKPQKAQGILAEPGLREAIEGKLLISILAGATTAQLQAWLPASTRVVRCMPNVAAKIRESMTVITPIDDEATRQLVLSLFKPIGRCLFLDESQFDASTALAGSGPAFAMIFLEAMADGGVMMGLPRQAAVEMAAQTMQGAARLVLQSGQHPAAIKDSVTTPAGCTIAGLLTMEDGKMRSVVARAVQAATVRASELGK